MFIYSPRCMRKGSLGAGKRICFLKEHLCSSKMMKQTTYGTSNADLKFGSRRSPVMATHGMVACSQPLAAEAGLSVLKTGGNAVDAAIAVAAALNVTEPCSTGLGGDCFILYYDSKTKKVHAMNGSGRAPAALSVEKLLADVPEAKETMKFPTTHPHSVTVPGTASGWSDAIEKWGTKPLSEVLEPAIRLAEEGFPVSPITAYSWKKAENLLKRNTGVPELLIPDVPPASASTSTSATPPAAGGDGGPSVPCHAPATGELFRNPTLAQTMRELGQKGKKGGFYEGRAGRAIVEHMQALGSTMTMDDLAAHCAQGCTFDDPISVEYNGVEVFEHPPNGQGITALIALNIIKGLGVERMAHNGVEYLHTLIETMRLAFADARWYVADPDKTHVPVAELLSPEYAAVRRALIDPSKATVDITKGSPVAQSNTVSFQVVDGEGNAVSMVNSNYMGFGTGIVPPGCGFSMQNRGANFSLEEGHPNKLEGGKRPYHTIIPAMILQKGELYASFTVMGGFMQPQGHVQMVLNMVDFMMEPQASLDQPRFCIGAHEWGAEISIEEGVDPEVVAALRAMGHNVRIVTGHARGVFGRGQIIRRLANGVLWAGSDPRADGMAIGW